MTAAQIQSAQADRATAPTRIPRRPAKPKGIVNRHPARPVPGTLHALQRQAGNSGLQRIISAPVTASTLLRCGAHPCDCPAEVQLRAELSVSHPQDPAEREADRIADKVMRTPAGYLRHIQAPPADVVRARPARAPDGPAADLAALIDDACRRGGQPLPPDSRDFMEGRFSRDFSSVRVHSDAAAGELARQVGARAFTTGNHVFFASGEYQPGGETGRHLLAHELVHVAQQSTDGGAISRLREQPDAGPGDGEIAHTTRPAVGIFRQESPPSLTDADLAAERQFGDKGAPKAQNCGRPAHCPPGFCSPYRSEELAKYYRAKNAGWLMAGISIAVDSRVVPLWREYLAGGSPPKNLTPEFGKDFTASPTTKKTTAFLYGELHAKLTSAPLFVPRFSRRSIGIGSLIPAAITALGDPGSPNQMNFDIPKDIPGNLAGGIGLDQKICPAGAQPSPFNDERHAEGTVELARESGREIMATAAITYQVRDTIDLCPGDCGTTLEQFATVPLSQFEATGIAGDIPFTIEFPAPPMAPFIISAPEGPEPPPGAGP